jgi:hypothetical protein
MPARLRPPQWRSRSTGYRARDGISGLAVSVGGLAFLLSSYFGLLLRLIKE